MPKREETSLYNGVWVDGAGPLTAALLLVGLAPGATEEKDGEPFVGPAGQMLQECVRDASLEWSSIRRTNAIRCRLPENRKPTDDELKEYKPWLLEEIASMPNLRLIVCLGNEAMKSVLGKSGITDKRGEELELELPGPESDRGPAGRTITVLPTFHPSYVLRRRSARQILVKDLSRARRILNGEPLNAPASGIFIHPPGHVTMPLTSHAPNAIDVETNELDRPRLYAVGSDPNDIHVFPAETIPERLTWNVWPWLGHFVNRDRFWMRTLGVNLTGHIDDTALMAHLLNENRSMSLKKLALELLDPEIYWRYVEPKLRKPTTRGAIPFNELGTYCAHDVAATLLIHSPLSKQLAARPRLQLIYDLISRPLNDVLHEMEWHGALIDKRAADDLVYSLENKLAEQDAELQTYNTGVDNWNSDAQVAHYLYDVLSMAPPHLTKSRERGSVDQKALMKLRWQHPIMSKIIARALAEKRREIAQSILDAIKSDGRIHSTFNPVGTGTGRGSSHDPNMQNVPTETIFRALVVAPEGRALVGADYKTLEFGIGAWQYGDKAMLDAYLTGDPHSITATRILGRAPADRAERKKFGKTPNFGLLFQQGDDGYRDYMAKQGFEVTLEEAAAQRAVWHSLYPGVRDGWRRIGLEMKEDGGTVTTASGRMRRLPEFLSGSRSLVNEAWRQGCNMKVQCPAAELTHIAAILAIPRLKEEFGADPILHVHDFLGFEVDVKYARDTARALKHIMEKDVPEYFARLSGEHVPIPLWAEVGTGRDWGHLEDLTEAA